MYEKISVSSPPPPADASERRQLTPARGKTVSLVLGAGGARGLAHIGVIQWLVENGYQIRSIAGSSMGALVGGVYATGELEVYVDWVLTLRRMNVARLLDPVLGRAGLFRGDRIISVLRALVGDRMIEDLPLSYTAVAADLDSGKEIWLREGNLFDAIRASIATPLLFTPFEYGDRRFIDGAVVNPIPIAPTLNDRTDLTVAVNLCGRADNRLCPPQEAVPTGNGCLDRLRARFKKPPVPVGSMAPVRGALGVALAAMDSMETAIARLKLAAYTPDVIVDIPRNACGFHEFWRGQELITLGRERAARAFGAYGASGQTHDQLVPETIALGHHHYHDALAEAQLGDLKAAVDKAADKATADKIVVDKAVVNRGAADRADGTAALLRGAISPYGGHRPEAGVKHNGQPRP